MKAAVKYVYMYVSNKINYLMFQVEQFNVEFFDL